MKLRARAKITLQIEIVAPSVWGDDCPMPQVYEQAAREAVASVEIGFQRAHINGKILGKPSVTVVIVEEQRDAENVVESST